MQKSYKNDSQIKAMTDLVDAYQRREVHTAEKILRGEPPATIEAAQCSHISVENRSTIMDDAFIRLYIGELLRSLRTQYLIDLIKPYTRLELSFLAQQLNVDKDEVEELLIGLILDGKVDGRIDQVTMRLELDKQSVPMHDSFHSQLISHWCRQSLEKRRYAALELWTEALEVVHAAVVAKNPSGAKGDPGLEMSMVDPYRSGWS